MVYCSHVQFHLELGTMNDSWNLHFPEQLSKIRKETKAAGFRMASDTLTGSLLCTLAASKPKGALLELGTGTGMGTHGSFPEWTLLQRWTQLTV